MFTRTAYWRSVIRKQFRSIYGKEYMHLLRWQAKRSKPRKEYVFIVVMNDMQYVVLVAA